MGMSFQCYSCSFECEIKLRVCDELIKKPTGCLLFYQQIYPIPEWETIVVKENVSTKNIKKYCA